MELTKSRFRTSSNMSSSSRSGTIESDLSDMADMVDDYLDSSSKDDLLEYTTDFANILDDSNTSNGSNESLMDDSDDHRVPIYKSVKDRIRDEFMKNDLQLAANCNQAPNNAKKIKQEIVTPPRPIKQEILSPRQFSLSPPTSPGMRQDSSDEDDKFPIRPKFKKGDKRPKTYKVEMTPLVSSDGFRHCNYCNGHVRPQMCGSRKHRWRCVDKRCRKWYGWVNQSEEMPPDIYAKGRWNSAFGTKPKKEIVPKIPKIPKKEATKRQSYKIAKVLDPLEEEVKRATEALQTIEKKKTAQKRKHSSSFNFFQRETSPLTIKEMVYVPCVMEKRARWWTSEKRRRDDSPERVIGSNIAEVAAALKICGNACSAAAATKANEEQSVNGALDILMDTLFGCLGPLLSLVAKVPGVVNQPSLVHNLWETSSVHIPTFH